MTSDTQLNGNELYQRQLKQKKLNAPVIICDGLQTPDNLGSILRVADAIGSKGIILLDSQIDLKNKKITKLARSADRHIPLKQVSFEEFSNNRSLFKSLYALEITSQSSNAFESNILPCDAVLLGHESRGIREEALTLCDGTFHLPMYGLNGSMNISHALAVFLYEWRRQESDQTLNK